MSKIRKSARISSNNMAKDDMIIIIKNPENGGPVEQIADVKTSIIEYMCNKCNKKYTTTLGLKRHLKFCNDSSSDICLTMPGRKDKNMNLSENHNDLNSKNLNLVSKSVAAKQNNLENDASANNVNKKPENPYEFEEEEVNTSDSNSEEEEVNDEKDEVCECCGESTETAHKAAIYKCLPCNKSYKLKPSLDLHLTKYHCSEEGAIQCELCMVSCIDEATMTGHMESHSGNTKRHSCSHCKKTFSRLYNLTRHLAQTGCDGRSKASLPCQVCGVEFTRKDNLRDHLRMHIGKGFAKKIYKCDYCQKEFKGKTMVAIHMRTHTGEKPFECKECPKAFKSKGALNKHERCHTGEKPHQCNQCSKRFAAKETLNRHLMVHMEHKPYICYLCGKSFIQCTQLRAHMFYHTGEFGFKCKYCDMTFNRKLKLVTHEKFVHEGAPKLNCTAKGCNKSFMKKDDLVRHMVTHSEEKPFSCEACSKSFRTRALLTTHSKTHRREKACSCPLCVRAFIRFDCLLRHLRCRHREKYQEVLVEARKAKLELMKSKLKNIRVDGNHVETAGSQGANRNNAGDITEEILLQVTESADVVEIGTLKSKLRSQSSKKADKVSLAATDDDSIVDITQETLLQIAESSEDVEVEIVDIPLSEDYLATSIQELLDLLIDKENFETFNWANQTVDDMLEGIIVKCGHTPAAPEITERPQRLRENAKLLLTVVIDDSAMKSLFETQTVDEVILNVLRLGKTN